MSLYKYLVLIALVTSTLICCKQKENETAAIRQQLMDLHDAGMSRMDSILQLSQRLRALKDSSGTDSGKVLLDKGIFQLKAADAAMMEWMHGYKEPDSSDGEDVKLHYYSSEIDKMLTVKTSMDKSIAEAKNIIKAYETDQ